MSVFAANAPQIWAREPRACESQFHAGYGGSPFSTVSGVGADAKRRNALAAPVSRYNAPRGDRLVLGRYCAMRAILAILFLCTAFAWREAQAEPSADTIARGQALVHVGDCASC